MTIMLSEGIRMRSGALFNYNDPASCPVTIDDLAGALANICRFAGHLPYFYSVAQHAVNASYIVAPGHEYAALMHDTAEAFTNDIPTPLKFAVPAFKELEVRIETAMGARFNFPYPLHGEVRLADAQMLGLEKDHIKGDDSEWEVLYGIPYSHLLDRVDLSSWSPDEARTRFLNRYHELTC